MKLKLKIDLNKLLLVVMAVVVCNCARATEPQQLPAHQSAQQSAPAVQIVVPNVIATVNTATTTSAVAAVGNVAAVAVAMPTSVPQSGNFPLLNTNKDLPKKDVGWGWWPSWLPKPSLTEIAKGIAFSGGLGMVVLTISGGLLFICKDTKNPILFFVVGLIQKFFNAIKQLII